MAALRSVKNQFLGINPLLHSRLQTAGGWDNFHVNHISDLTRFLQRDLRELGYLAQAEQSLQIRRHSRYRAIGIYQKTANDARGDAVAWLELLSPANKPGERHFAAYRDKRTALLQAGLVFIELDYLHQQAPTVAAPIYSTATDSTPYRVVVINPRPDWLSGQGRVYAIGMDARLPTVDIPLNAGDLLHFDFDAPYQQTYAALFFGDDVDYRKLPTDWDKYHADDHAKMLTRLLAIRDAAANLGDAPAPLEPLALTVAMERWHQQ